jgi:gliding motility-associated-like protein
VFVLFCLSAPGISAQSSLQKTPGFVGGNDIFGTRNFIENKGQYGNPLRKEDAVLFVYDHLGEKIYFTAKGLVYELTEPVSVNEDEHEEARPGSDPKKYFVSMSWVNAGTPEVTPSEKQSHYFTFGGPEYNSSAFKRIYYKNVYDKIDFEFVIPKDKEYGIKYNVILHPGADPDKIKMKYSGDIRKMGMNSSGELVIATPADNITEHPPVGLNEEQTANSVSFILKDKVVAFAIEGHNPSVSFTIDPWVTAITTFTLVNGGHDVDFDFSGNTFVYGGSTNGANTMRVAKFNSSGVLVWTFSGVIILPVWNTTNFLCGIAAEKSTGKIYVSRQSATNIVRLNASGNYDNFITGSSPAVSEGGDISFICNGDLIQFGGCCAGGSNSTSMLYSINNQAGYLWSSFQPTYNTCCLDFTDYAVDAVGNYFVLYGGGGVSYANKLARVAPSFTNSIWLVPSGFSCFSEAGNRGQLLGAGSIASLNYNALDVNMNYLYYYNGLNISAYDKITGTVVATAAVAGQVIKQTAGIAVDECDNIYVGGNGSIICYHFNGVSFSTLTPIPLNAPSATPAVYDMMLDKANKILHVAGCGFVGQYTAIYSQSCSPVSPTNQCYFGQWTVSATSTSITCASLGSATVSAIGGLGPYSYLWIPSNQSGSVAVGLAPGTYTLFVSDLGTNYSFSTTVLFTSLIPLTGNVVSSAAVPCFGYATATAGIINLAGGSGNQSYLWTNGMNTQTTAIAGSLSAGSWSVTVTDALTGCMIHPTFNISQPPQLTSYILASTPTACAGETISLNGITAGGAPGSYVYLWNSGVQQNTLNVSQNNAGAYAYSLNSVDGNNCSVTAVANVTYVPNPTLTVADAYICPLETGTLNVSGATTYSWSNNTFTNYLVDSPPFSAQYTVIGMAQSCTSSAVASIYLKPVPSPQFISNSPICNGQNLQLDVSTAVAYTWSGPQSFTSSLKNPAMNIVSPINSGIYAVTVTALNSCTASASGSVTIHPTPTVVAAGASVCVNQTLNLSANASSATGFSWKGPNNFVSNQQNPFVNQPLVIASGFYSVIATSAAGCTNIAVAHASITALPNPGYSSNSPRCFGNNLSLSATGALQYNWSGPNSFNSNQQFPQLGNVSLAANGIYTLIVTTGPCQVTQTLAAIIYPLPTPTIISNVPVCEGKQLALGVSNNSITTILWHGPQGFSGSYAYMYRDSALQSQSGIYSVTVVDLHNCINSATAAISIFGNPTLSAKGDEVCFSDPASLSVTGAAGYFWQGPSGYYNASDKAVIQSATNVAPEIYTVTGTGVNGCTTVAMALLKTIPLPEPWLSVEPGTKACLNGSIVLSGFGGSTYEWNGPGKFHFPDGKLLLRLNSAEMAGIYTLTAYNVTGCKNYTQTPVEISMLPEGSLQGRMESCVPFCSDYYFQPSLRTSSNVSVKWQLDGKAYAGDRFRHCFTEPDTYTIAVMINDPESNCWNTVTYFVSAYEKPQADFSWSPENPVEGVEETIFISESRGGSQNKWIWYFGELNEIIERQNPNYLFSGAGRFPVAFIVQTNKGCKDTVVKYITVEPDFHVYVPNVFTPNGDELNEVFLPIVSGIKKYKLQVFDRWGERIYVTFDSRNGWDGSYRSQECKTDSYIWKIDCTTNQGEERKLSGNILLTR